MKPTYVCNLESFLKDVERHEIKVLRDDGVYRHVRFSRPDSGCMHFDLVTYPGFLVYSGDMGCFVFERLPDMFEFFRNDEAKPLRINLGYWSEKCQAADRDGIEEFSRERFKEKINEWVTEHCEGEAREYRKALKEEVDEEILRHVEDEGEDELMRRAYDFRFRDNDVFADFYETRCTVYTQRFTWCCYALAWGIRKYDEHKAEPRAAA